MVEKNTLSKRKEKRNEFNTDRNENSESSFHERNLRLISLPVLASFTLFNYFSHIIFLVFQYLWEHLSELGGCLIPLRRFFSHRRHLNPETGNVITSNTISIDMLKPEDRKDQFQEQKLHHHNAFEYISRALKMDEENQGSLNQIFY